MTSDLQACVSVCLTQPHLLLGALQSARVANSWVCLFVCLLVLLFVCPINSYGVTACQGWILVILLSLKIHSFLRGGGGITWKSHSFRSIKSLNLGKVLEDNHLVSPHQRAVTSLPLPLFSGSPPQNHTLALYFSTRKHSPFSFDKTKPHISNGGWANLRVGRPGLCQRSSQAGLPCRAETVTMSTSRTFGLLHQNQIPARIIKPVPSRSRENADKLYFVNEILTA